MKRKQIKKIAPVQPTRKGKYITTVQKMENILILNVYKDGKLRGRHALNPETGEYCQYREEEGDWKYWKYASLLDIDTSLGGWYGTEDKKRAVFDTEEQEQMVKEELQVGKKILWKTNTFDLIDEAEREYGRAKREKTENNRVRRVQDKMNLVPELPEDAYEWIWQQEGAEDFAFWDKGSGKWTCTACVKSYAEKYLKRTDGSRKVKHNDMAVCPRCKKTIMAKKLTHGIEKKTHFTMLQKIDERMSVFRHFDVKLTWDERGRRVYINEAVRMIMNHISTFQKYCLEIYYNQYSTGGAYGTKSGWDYEYAYFDNKANPAHRREYAGLLYPHGIEEALNDMAYTSWGRIFAQMAAGGQKLDYNRLLCLQNNTAMVGVVEYLFKGRFYKLLEDTADNVSYWASSYYGPLHIKGNTIEEIFGIQDRQIINRIRDVNGGDKVVSWMQWSVKKGKKISQEALEWLSRNDIEQRDIDFIKDRMSLQQIMNYVNRQQEECYRSKTVKQILSQWSDYLDMLKRIGKKTDDAMMFRPRELKRRHDECVEEIRRQQMIEEMKRDRKQRYAEAKRMREKFPGAEDILKEIKQKYEYTGEKYLIIVPRRLVDIMTEGQALHHCAGTTDRYFDRIMQNETYICFLRKVSDPKTPFYTIEVEPGGTIRQHRGYLDEEPGIEEIKPFLREWQKVIRKRMSKEDHERAAVSAVKRQENIEELKAKNNTRVLNGLMEDFMEAI